MIIYMFIIYCLFGLLLYWYRFFLKICKKDDNGMTKEMK